MIRPFLMAAAAALIAAAAIPQAATNRQAGLATPPRITVITKNSEYPRLNRDGLASQRFAQGQWI